MNFRMVLYDAQYKYVFGIQKKVHAPLASVNYIKPEASFDLFVLQMFHHILNGEREVFWQYGKVTCAAFSLKDLDTVR